MTGIMWYVNQQELPMVESGDDMHGKQKSTLIFRDSKTHLSINEEDLALLFCDVKLKITIRGLSNHSYIFFWQAMYLSTI